MTTPVQQKVLEFVLAPERSNANHLMKLLASYGFFGPGKEEANISILKQILEAEKHQFCDAGIQKFKDHMGELLYPERRRVITVEVSVPENGPVSFYNDTSVASDISRYLERIGNPDGNFYNGVKVKAVKDEIR